mgnify:CR=1 FL=1
MLTGKDMNVKIVNAFRRALYNNIPTYSSCSLNFNTLDDAKSESTFYIDNKLTYFLCMIFYDRSTVSFKYEGNDFAIHICKMILEYEKYKLCN